MRLHVLTGCRELLQPEVLHPEIAAGMVGDRIRVATAFWIAPAFGDSYHDFLQDGGEDSRTGVLAQALKDDFGARFEPLLILPELLDHASPGPRREAPGPATERRSQLEVLSEILACGHVRELYLYGVALPVQADPDACWAIPTGIVPGKVRERIEGLRTASAAFGPCTVQSRVIEATPDLPAFVTLYNNSLCNQIVRRLRPRLLEQGWACDTEILGRAISRILADRNAEGIFLDLPLRAGHLDAVTELVYKKVL